MTTGSSLKSFRALVRWLVIPILITMPLHAATLRRDNFETANPWTSMAGYFTTGGGSVTATPTWTTVGTIDTYGSGTASSGVQFAVDSSAATGNWTAGLTSGVLDLSNNTGATAALALGFRTLSFSLSASSAYPVRVKIESYNSSGARTGGRSTLIFPAAADFYQRYAIDLDTMTADLTEDFMVGDPKVQITFELDSTANAGTSWPAAAGHTLKIDNINLSTPKYYVKPGGAGNQNGLTEANALATVQAAASKFSSYETQLQADPNLHTDNIVAIMDGGTNPEPDYNSSPSGAGFANQATVALGRRGRPDAWIVFKNYPGHKPVLSTYGWAVFKLVNNSDGGSPNTAAYIEIRGLTLRGLSSIDANGDRQINPAYESWIGQVGGADGTSNGNGISVEGNKNTTLQPHHFRFADNTVEYMPGGGINVLHSDRVQVENNLVRYNCWWMAHAGSGLNFFQIRDTETGSSYRMLMRDNVVYGNECMVPWFESNGQFSDGNGIILDTYTSTYTGKTLLANNLVFNNGGGGVHVLAASNVDVVHNTAFMNSASPHQAYPQIDTQGTCVNVRTTNNIGVAPRNTTGVNTFDFQESAAAVTVANGSLVHTRNVYVGGDKTPLERGVLSADNTYLGSTSTDFDPKVLFINPSINPAAADFRLRSTAAARNYGSAIGYRGTRDIAGTPRPLTGSTDTGVYQSVSSGTYSPMYSVASGNYFGATPSVALSSDTAGAAIVYTTNGDTPAINPTTGAATTGTPYGGPISVSTTTTVKAIAWASGSTSPVSTAIYDFTDLSAVPLALELWQQTSTDEGEKLTDGGTIIQTTYARAIQGLTRTPGASIRYTTNGTDPTATTGAPQVYRGFFPTSETTNLRYRAFKAGRPDSPVSSVTVIYRAAMGNTADGTTLTTFGAGNIRFVRFHPTTDFTASYIFARINGVTANYRAAIFSDASSAPSGKLAESTLISIPVTGWTAFPLTAAASLSAKSGNTDKYYWLAIWSDSANAGIFSSGTTGTVREKAATFSSTWPAATGTTTVTGDNTYAIYAANSPPNLPPVVSAGSNQSTNTPVVLSGIVTDDGVPLAPGTVTSVWSKVSGPGALTFANSASPITTATFSIAGNYVLRLTARDALLTSTGDVTIQILDTPLLSWRVSSFNNTDLADSSKEATVWGNAADVDGDNLSNLNEFAFGTNPASSSVGRIVIDYLTSAITRRGQPIVEAPSAATGVNYRVVFGRRKDWQAAGLSYLVQFSANLVIWEDSTTTTPTVVASDQEMEAVAVPYPSVLSTGEKAQFVRVRATLF